MSSAPSPQLVHRDLKSSGEFLCRTSPPVVEEINGRLRGRHVVMDGDHIQPIRTQDLENWRDF